MTFGSFDSRRHQEPMAEINVVPLVDVMLVFLVIFIITAPLLTNSEKIDLPKALSNVISSNRIMSNSASARMAAFHGMA